MFPNSNTSISARSCSCRSPAIGLLTYRCNLAFGFKVIRLQLTFYARLQKTNLLENCNYFATAKEQFRSSTSLGKKILFWRFHFEPFIRLKSAASNQSCFFFFFTNNGEISNRWQSVIPNLKRAIFLLECIPRKKNEKKMRSFQTGEKIFNRKKQFYRLHFFFTFLIESLDRNWFEALF